MKDGGSLLHVLTLTYEERNLLKQFQIIMLWEFFK